MSVKICFCYSHEDEPLLKKLKAHLRPMQREGLIETWHDRNISPGTEWEKAIKEQLETADIILLLISSDFMDSDYCYSTEMQQALERSDRGNAKVIPIILRPVYWQGTLGKLQALPTDGVAVTDPGWHSLDKALFNVAEGIRHIINKLSTKQLPAEINKVEQSEQIAYTAPQEILRSSQPNQSKSPSPMRMRELSNDEKEICSLLSRIQKRLKQLENVSNPNNTFTVWEYSEKIFSPFSNTVQSQIKITIEYVISSENIYLLEKKPSLVNTLSDALQKIDAYKVDSVKSGSRMMKAMEVPIIGEPLFWGNIALTILNGDIFKSRMNLSAAAVHLRQVFYMLHET